MEDAGDCHLLLVEPLTISIFHSAIGYLVIPANFMIEVPLMSMKLQLLSAAPETLWLIRQSVLLTTSGALVQVYDRFRGGLT